MSDGERGLFGLGFIFRFVAGFLLVGLTIESTLKDLEKELIKRGVKQYNSTTGVLEWVEKGPEK